MTKYDQTDVEGIKRKARLISREAGIPHRQALDILAKAAGHNHWGAYRAVLDAGFPSSGWSREGRFTAYPPLMHDILSRDDVTLLAINADGSVWTSGDREGSAEWTRLDASKIDDVAARWDFMQSIPTVLNNASGLTFLVTSTRSDRHDDRFVARRPSQRRRMVEMTIRKGPMKNDPRLARDVNWSLETPAWHAHLFSTRAVDAVRKACDHVVGDRPDTTRIVTFGVKADERRHPNRVEAFGPLYDEDSALDYGVRVSGDAFVAIANTPARAAAAITLAKTGHGPFAILVDADPADMIGRLADLTNRGNVHPMSNVRKGLQEALAVLPECCTIHG